MQWATLAKRVGDNVRRLRKARGLTQEQMADLAGSLSLRYLQTIELGRANCSLHSLVRVAKALQVDPKELLA